MRLAAISLLPLLAMASCLPQEQADGLHLLQGEWQQTGSTAGECKTCTISIEPKDNTVLVTANNGWSATFYNDPLTRRISATAQGAWKPDIGGAYAGKQFRLHLVSAEQQLVMLMSVPKPDGRTWNITGLFRKVDTARHALQSM